jgi:uncharacterized protein
LDERHGTRATIAAALLRQLVDGPIVSACCPSDIVHREAHHGPARAPQWLSTDPGGLKPVTTPRPEPLLDRDNRAFWTGGADGKLYLHHCNDCGGYIHPPRPVCRHCLSDDVAPRAVAGTGVIDTYTINHQAWMPGMEVPFIIARVAIDGAPGVILTTNIVNCPIDAVEFGDKVRVTFQQQGEIYFPLFEKIAA